MSIELLEKTLLSVLNGLGIWQDGGVYEKRELVDKYGSLKIEIYPNEHNPPHFHVKTNGIDASFTIEKCEKLNGSISSNDYKKIQYWYRNHKTDLIEVWNKLRPDTGQTDRI